jgi:hypothetical protein
MITSDRCVSCPVSQFIAKPMTSKMKTAARPISINVRIRSDRTIKADLSQSPTMRHHDRFDQGARFKLARRNGSTSFANYNPASG